QGSQIIEDIARRHYVSVDAAMTLLQALVNGGGTMAQFSHPEFGGSGQWMQGGMTMVGDMFNNNLKAKVDNLCYELAGVLANQPLFAPQPPPQNYGQASLFVDNSGQWWPGDLGSPSSSGAQNNLRYAIFPASRRLAIDLNGAVTVYDTLDHQIGGVGQQQGGGASFTFTSQYGLVPVSSLPVVSGFNPAPPPAYEPQPFNNPAPVYDAPNAAEADIFAKIERLAELRQKGILSDSEFAAKKSELLSRI
ncbi:MAG: SHOCT domain-containing protein, partial [Candidatus Methylumidiphilus sp.]